MSRISELVGPAVACGIVLLLVWGPLGATPARGAAGDGKLLELLLGVFLAAETERASTSTAPASIMSRDIMFDFATSDVRSDETDKIKDIADLMRQEPSLLAQLDGFTDPRGSSSYNLGLRDRRVKAVRDALVAYGVASSRVQIAAMADKSGHCLEATEACYERNRRVEVQIRRS